MKPNHVSPEIHYFIDKRLFSNQVKVKESPEICPRQFSEYKTDYIDNHIEA